MCQFDLKAAKVGHAVQDGFNQLLLLTEVAEIDLSLVFRR